MCDNNFNNEALIAQLSNLNTRVNIYASRLWHMPFAFLAIVCVSVSQFENIKNPMYIISIGIVLFFTGFIVLSIIRIHRKRIDKLILVVHGIEAKLNLGESMEAQKDLPYYLLVATCMVSVISIILYQWFCVDN